MPPSHFMAHRSIGVMLALVRDTVLEVALGNPLDALAMTSATTLHRDVSAEEVIGFRRPADRAGAWEDGMDVADVASPDEHAAMTFPLRHESEARVQDNMDHVNPAQVMGFMESMN